MSAGGLGVRRVALHTRPTLAFAMLLSTALWAVAQPIDCSSAASEDEVAICNSEDLRTMDGELDRAYRAARVRWTASMSNSVKAMHEDWIKERRKCGADQACLMARMVEQIQALDRMRPESPTWILEKTRPSK